MKSQLFRSSDDFTDDDFSKDIQFLYGLDPAIIQQLAPHALCVLEAPSNAEREKAIKEAAKALSAPASQLEHAIYVVIYFLRQFAPKGGAEQDQPENIADDLIELFKTPPEKHSAIVFLLKETQALAREKVQATLLHLAYSQTALPILSAVSAVVDFRAVFDEPFKYENDVAQFSPKFMGTLPLGIIEIKLRGAHSKEIFFQANKRSIQILIDTLVALQKQIDIAEQGIKVK